MLFGATLTCEPCKDVSNGKSKKSIVSHLLSLKKKHAFMCESDIFLKYFQVIFFKY